MKEGWVLKKLVEVSEIEKIKQPLSENIYVGLEHIESNTGKFIGNLNPITVKSATFKFSKNHVLYGRLRPYLNKVLLPDFSGHCSSEIFPIKPNNNVLKKYLYYWLTCSKTVEMINSTCTGARMPRANMKEVSQFCLPIPPISEQKQIVAILDKAFAAIDQAKTNIEKNIQNAQELFQSKLNEIFSYKGEGWEEKTLGEVCVVERGSSPRPIKNYLTDSEEGVNWIKIGDVPENDKYVKSTKQKITREGAKKSRFVDVGDFILSNSMSFGRPYIMAIQGYIHDGWFVLRLPNYLNPDYFWQLLASPYIKEQFNSLAAGAIVKNISGDLVKKALIPIPPLNDQEKIFHETEKLKKQINLIINKYLIKAENLEELKKSILQKAFAGELTYE